ncbi:MAG: hypothetical protein FWD90_01105 [Defluviitaleaceae bacterium]|nr:hypothetical protein [Defluviitaleaceae bacterium]
MKTKRQIELVNTFLSSFGDGLEAPYRAIAEYLSELGYNPKKEGSNLSFKHDLHNKQMVKMGRRNDKNRSPFFSLRFSACKSYSQRFAEIVITNINKYPQKSAGCLTNTCNYCAGEPGTYVYTHTFPDGESKSHCGAYVLEIPQVTEGDVEEIKGLIREEHEYLMKHEAGGE